MSNAPAPSTTVSKQTISWGLINIPVKLFSATEETRVARKQFTGDDNDLHPVGRQAVDKVTGEVIDQSAIRSFATASDGTLVELTDNEVASITGPSTGVAPIEALVPLSFVGAPFCVPEKVYQLRANADPKLGGSANERALALLLTALESRQEAALVHLAIRGGVAKPAVLLPSGDLYVLHYEDAVRARRPLPTIDLTEAELGAAKALLACIPTGLPTLTNETAERIQEYVDAKAAGTAPTASSAPEQPTNVPDLLAALQASVDAHTAGVAR